MNERGLVTLLKTMKPLSEDFPEIDDPALEPEIILSKTTLLMTPAPRHGKITKLTLIGGRNGRTARDW
ncbi:hypothetical protein [Inquilinus limosus]|uniref:hypothetical protein n=1 Tax=Inquilinus limosus TaxID=171674 RepID=UPI00126A3E09|nr:hypothetical protein [Inquilinus limosus]